jgi:aminoglycoside phosphotransferase (APT) family kinase protein
VVPRFQAYLPDLRLALLDAVPGSPLLPALLRTDRPAEGGPTAADAVAACARVAAALHRSSIPVGPARSLSREVEEARAAVEGIEPLAPALATALLGHLHPAEDVSHDRPGPPVVAHGDLRPARVLFDGPTTSLVNFDQVCLAEPALDLGQFTGHLAAAGAGEELGSAFLREYAALDGRGDAEELLARVAAYRTVALVRLAVHRWSRLQPDRLRPVLALLREPQRTRVP